MGTYFSKKLFYNSKKIMKIFFDATVFEQPFTGVAKSTLELYKACFDIDSNIQFTALYKNNLYEKLPHKIKSVQIAKYVPNKIWRHLVISSKLKSEKNSIIHFPWNGNIPKLPSDITVITTFHDVLPLIIPEYFKSNKEKVQYCKKVQKDINRTDLLITDSEFSKKQIIKNFKLKKDPIVIYLGPSIKLKKHLENKYNSYFLYVGGYDKRKGIEELINIFLKLKQEKEIESRLILTGAKKYYSAELKKLIYKGIKNNSISELGYVEDNLLANLFLNAKALIYPSKYEGFGLPILDAMSLGCPVVTTRETSIPEVGGDAPLYIDSDNKNEFTNAVINIEKDINLREKLKAKGLKQSKKFSWQKSAANFLKNLQKVVKEI